MTQSITGASLATSLAAALPTPRSLATSLEVGSPVEAVSPAAGLPVDRASCKAGQGGSYGALDFDACERAIDHSQDQAGNIGRPGSKATNTNGGRG